MANQKKTKQAYQQYLNEFYSDMDFETAREELIYMTVKTRAGGYINSPLLNLRIRQRKCGEVLRKYDPIAFTCGFNDWKLTN
jgi:hemerythrin superfamily protein